MNITNPNLERIVEDVTVSNFLRCRETGFQVAEARALLQSTSPVAIERGIARLSRQIEQLRDFLPEESAFLRPVAANTGEPVAWLRPGEYVPVQNAPFGSMWISDKYDPRAFPVFASPSVVASDVDDTPPICQTVSAVEDAALSELTNERKERVLLRVIAGMGGEVESSDTA
ncbi:hypothetical protein JVX98_28190 [Ensifer sp. PDNC004]|uniref:hypothetical protein n=1 Tax=Ensifer sp. PDNC004 TaxID=2811423 RepID=UPI00196627FE|nr:hypothetical protein [Ensifer sp. PDNC004]QRY68171.1 hypothetical protein JVX98_28190 [Ensifer sp. PDNC004]